MGREPTEVEDLDPDLITVVIPCRNEEMAIEACLRSVLQQDGVHLQVLVVDGASEDRTREVVEGVMAEDPRVELLSNPSRIVPTAMNVALAAARGAWLVRVDAHASIPAGYIMSVVTHLRTGAWGGVGGRKDGRGVTAAGRAIAAAMGSRFGVGGSAYHHATTAREVEHIPFGAYPTSLARRLGGWDERMAVNQDFEFDHRVGLAGHRLLLDPSLVIDWESRQSISELFHQYRRYGSGKVDVLRKHPASASPRHLAPPATVVLLATAGGIGLRRPLLGLLVAAPYAAFLATGTRSVRAALARDPAARRYAAPALATMHLAWGVGFLEGVVRHAWCSVVGQDPSLGAVHIRSLGADHAGRSEEPA